MDVVAVVDKLDELGILRANRIIGNWYSIYCPIHSDGQEKHPSCGVLIHEEFRNGQVYPEALVHCFSCGLAKPLSDVVNDVLKNKHISEKSGLEWLKENIPEFEEVEFDYLVPQGLIQALNGNFAVNYVKSKSKNQIKYVEESELANYRFTVPYLYERKLTDSVIEKFDVGVDLHFIPPGRKREVPCVTFPVRNIDGNVLFIYRRALNTKQFYMPAGLEKPIYGLYELENSATSVILCESIFNALTCYVYGYPALALFGTGTKSQISELQRMGIKEFILGLDPDDAGISGCRKLKKALQSVAIVRRMDIPESKDINDLSYSEFMEALENRV